MSNPLGRTVDQQSCRHHEYDLCKRQHSENDLSFNNSPVQASFINCWRGPSRPTLPGVIVEVCSWSFLKPHSNLAKLVLALVVAHNKQKKANLARYSRFGGSRLAASEFPKVFDLTLFLGMEIDGELCALLTRLCSSVSIILFHRLRHSLAPQLLSRNIPL